MNQQASRGGNWIESLESRRLLSSTLLSASAVEGSYKGTAIANGASDEVKVQITATKITVTVVGEASGTEKLSASALKKLRSGVFTFTGSAKGATVTLSGKYTSAGLRIGGTFSAKNGSKTVDGTFAVKK